MPKRLRPTLESEGLLLCDEGIGGWLIMKDLKAPGKRFKHRMEGFTGFLAITRKRLIAYAYWKRIVNIDFEDNKIAALDVAMPTLQRLELSFDANVFQPKWEGRITLRFHTPKASDFYSVLKPDSAQIGVL